MRQCGFSTLHIPNTTMSMDAPIVIFLYYININNDNNNNFRAESGVHVPPYLCDQNCTFGLVSSIRASI